MPSRVWKSRVMPLSLDQRRLNGLYLAIMPRMGLEADRFKDAKATLDRG